MLDFTAAIIKFSNLSSFIFDFKMIIDSTLRMFRKKSLNSCYISHTVCRRVSISFLPLFRSTRGVYSSSISRHLAKSTKIMTDIRYESNKTHVRGVKSFDTSKFQFGFRV